MEPIVASLILVRVTFISGRERNVITLALPRPRPHGIRLIGAARDFMYSLMNSECTEHMYVIKGLYQKHVFIIYTTTGPVGQDLDLENFSYIINLK